jgi:hypothetical protein
MQNLKLGFLASLAIVLVGCSNPTSEPETYQPDVFGMCRYECMEDAKGTPPNELEFKTLDQCLAHCYKNKKQQNEN